MARGIDIRVDVVGSKRLARKFAKLDAVVQRKAIRKATRAGAKAVLQDAKRLAPRETGALTRSGKVRAMRRSRVAQGHVARFEALHSFQVETGTSDTPPQPFIRPALDINKPRIFKAVRDEVNRAILEASRG
jgi:HK97 gp10 family phage protein